MSQTALTPRAARVTLGRPHRDQPAQLPRSLRGAGRSRRISRAPWRSSDTQLGWLVPAFMLVYMLDGAGVRRLGRSRLAHPADRHRHLHLESRDGAVGPGAHLPAAARRPRAWSASARPPTSPSRRRCSPTVFRASSRGRVYAVLNMAIPVGSALGYVLGGPCAHAPRLARRVLHRRRARHAARARGAVAAGPAARLAGSRRWPHPPRRAARPARWRCTWPLRRSPYA